MKLAWRNLNHDRLRFVVTLVGIAFATFLMVFQGSLLVGFLRAASKVIDASEADLWITPRGVSCFEFGAPLPKRFRELALGVPGVSAVQRAVSGYVPYQTPSGLRQTIFLVGAEPGAGATFPLPYLNPTRQSLLPETVLVDESNAVTLEAAALPLDVEISQRRARVGHLVTGFGSFLGAPYVFTAYPDAVRYLGTGNEDTMFLLVHLAPGAQAESVQQALQTRLPEADVWTSAEFSRRARIFWVIKTGAGGAILVAGLLGFIVGLVVVSQNIYATTMENLEEFATLKAIGATRWFVQRVVLHQALVSGIIGSTLGLAATYPIVQITLHFIAWIQTPWWLPLGMIFVSLLMCALAAVFSVRKAVAVEPGRVFRA
jgi:putative ABC transport system permease protein